MGVLYAGFCSAIIFSKVLRIQSQAQVRFSDPLIIQYGSGVKRAYSADSSRNIPCPILEFRIVNRFHDQEGCEIIGAQMSCMILKAGTAAPKDPLERSGSGDRRVRTKQRSEGFSLHRSSMTRTMPRRSKLKKDDLRDSLDNVDYNVSQLKIDMVHHPFFKMLWTVRHVLNESSPILTIEARRAIKKNRGYWPQSLCSHTALRQNILFDQMIVNLNGISNISANQVYAQKIYHLKDVSIGYKFTTVVYQNRETGGLMLDINGINSVNEQDGGGGESLRAEDKKV